MSILSDKQIRQLCSPPTFIVKELVEAKRDDNGMHDVYILPTEKEYPTWASEGELCAKPRSYGRQFSGIVGWRVPTAEDLHRHFKLMIEPFVPQQVRSRAVCVHNATDGIENDRYEDQKIISYGLTSFGYDVRCADEFKIFTNINSTRIDPKNFDSKNFVDFKGPVCIVPPNSFVLARTVERFNIPRDVVADCLGKSTYARCGVSVMVTPLEPEWEGFLTLEFANTTPLPAMIYANEGCAQIRFFRGDEPCETSYKDRNGKYMGQGPAPIPPKV